MSYLFNISIEKDKSILIFHLCFNDIKIPNNVLLNLWYRFVGVGSKFNQKNLIKSKLRPKKMFKV